MMKSIVAAVDGSQESIAALEHAAIWATRLDAELRGVFVEDERDFVTFPNYSDSEGTVPKPVPLPERELEEVKQRVRREGDQLRRKFKKIAAKQKARNHWHVERGRVNEVLIDEARSADLTVIGRNGLNAAPELHRIGPTAEDLIHQAFRPVLVVPGSAQKKGAEGSEPHGPFLAAFDGGSAIHRAMVAGAELASAMQASVTVLTVHDDRAAGETLQAPLSRYLQAYGLRTHFQVEPGEKRAAQLILQHAWDMKAGMILMGAFSHSPIKEFFFGSTTRAVLTAAPCPVLLMT